MKFKKNVLIPTTILFSLCLLFFVSCKDDDDLPCTETTWYEDADADGLGNPDVSQSACDQPTGYVADNTDTNDSGTVTQLHAAFAEFDADRVTVILDGSNYVVTATGRPNHETEYYPVDNPLHIEEDIDHTGAALGDPSYIEDGGDYEITFTIDASPDLTGDAVATSLGAQGVAVSGAYIYNNYEGPTVLSTMTAESLDWTGAHIGNMGAYHYHLEPHAFSSDDSNLIGILADGIFIYGRKCSATGDYPTDLDSSGGHTGVTQHNAAGEYHYHMINEEFFAGTEKYLIFEGPFMGY